MTQPTLSEIIALLDKPEFQVPWTTFQFEDGWIEYVDAHPLDLTNPPPGQLMVVDSTNFVLSLRAYLRTEIKSLLNAINIPYLNEVIRNFQAFVLGKPDVQYESFALSTDSPSYAEVQEVVTRIYKGISDTQIDREACNHYTTVLKSAQDYLTSFKKVMEQFVLDPANFGGMFERLSERQRFVDALAVDLEAYSARLQSLRTTISNINDNVLSPRTNIYMRTDSAVRLLVKMDDQDKFLGHAQARPNTMAPVAGKDIGDADFQIDEVSR